MRSTARLTSTAKKTVERLLVAAGKACFEQHDKLMRNLSCRVLQVDEIWSFCACKESNVPQEMKGQVIAGDTWLWVALDAESKLIPAYHVGARGAGDANWFISDLASRLKRRVQLTSDGLGSYTNAIENAFGSET